MMQFSVSANLRKQQRINLSGRIKRRKINLKLKCFSIFFAVDNDLVKSQNCHEYFLAKRFYCIYFEIFDLFCKNLLLDLSLWFPFICFPLKGVHLDKNIKIDRLMK